MSTSTTCSGESEIAILARVLANGSDRLPEELARYILDLDFSNADKARMHDLVVRNQEDALTTAEKEQLTAFGKAGDMLAILKSKARRSLGIKPRKPIPS